MPSKTTVRIWFLIGLILCNDSFIHIICNSHFQYDTDDLSYRLKRSTTSNVVFPSRDVIRKLMEQNYTLDYLASFSNYLQRATIHGQLEACPYISICSFSFNIVYPFGDAGAKYDCCQPCRCDYPPCMETRSCCPDIIPESYFQTNNNSFQPLESLKCVPLIVTQRKQFGELKRESAFMYADCPYGTGEDIREKCEEIYTYEGVDTLDDIVPVSDQLTGYTYRNRFCAMCRGAALSDMIVWTKTLNCQVLPYEFPSANTLKQRIFLYDTCQLNFETPDNRLVLTNCYEKYDVVSFCNITGLWSSYDPFVERQCELYSSHLPVSAARSDKTNYQNIFCGICNGKTEIEYTCYDKGDYPSMSFSFSGLLETKHSVASDATEKDTVAKCQHEVYNPFTDSCDPIRCPILHVFHDGECITAVNSNIEVPLEIVFKVIPDSLVTLEQFMGESYFSSSSALETLDWDKTLESGEGTWSSFWSLSTLETLFWDKREEVGGVIWCERNFQFVTENGNVPVNSTDLMKNKVLYIVVREVVILSGSPFVYTDYFGSPMFFLLMLNQYEGVSKITVLTDHEDKKPIKHFDNSSIVIVNQSLIRPSKESCKGNDPPFTVNQIRNCSLIEFRNDWLNWSKIDNGVYFDIIDFTVTDDYLILNENSNDRIYVCKDIFKKLTDVYMNFSAQSSISPKTEYSIGYDVEEIISIACVSLSLLCLIFTVVVYAMFPALRTLPGKNTMMLAVYIFTAQTLYLIASFGRLEQESVSCIAIGIALHFSWLLVIAWMFVCTYHVARVLMSYQIVRNRDHASPLCKYHAFASSVSMFFVGLTIILSGNESNWSYIGYGVPFCYISDSTMQRYTFWLPVLVILLVNLGLFVGTICFVKRNNISTRNSSFDRNYLLIFTKLLSLTGISWLFGFLYSWLQIAVFSYLFIIVNGSIGVILMVSFTTSGRTFKLLKTKVWRSSINLTSPEPHS